MTKNWIHPVFHRIWNTSVNHTSYMVMMTMATAMLLTMPLFVADADSDSDECWYFDVSTEQCLQIHGTYWSMQNIRIYFSSLHQSLIRIGRVWWFFPRGKWDDLIPLNRKIIMNRLNQFYKMDMFNCSCCSCQQWSHILFQNARNAFSFSA